MSDTEDHPEHEPYDGPSGGYGSLKSVAVILARERIPERSVDLLYQNKPGGFMCTSCAWAKPAEPHSAEFCENGVKATAWETTAKRADEAFFERHTLTELEGWRDFDLEEAGRLTRPMRYEAASDRYVPVPWEEAFAEIGAHLRALASPDEAVFYTSGRASLETSYLYQLFARAYGTNNLPDSSNMCHEPSSVGLPESIGVPVGTIQLDDFDACDLILYVAHNVATSSPRMLHQFAGAAKRGVPIISVNPLREKGLRRFKDPQSPREMLTGEETEISQTVHQVRVGGDLALMTGLCKAVIALDATRGGVLDRAFLDEHCAGFEDFAAWCEAADWDEIERLSGLSRTAIEAFAGQYARANNVIALYGMGLTQQMRGTENVRMLVNLLLLRGNMGRPGAGICAVRGHSNVQGQRTVGITEKPSLAPLDQIRDLYGFEPPRHTGKACQETFEGIVDGSVKALVQLGGNLLRAAPDRARLERAWRELPLTVSIATKLNRGHVVHGRAAYLLPCLGRIEVDAQATGPQAVSMEDSTAHFHGSKGRVRPASEHLRSEPAIVAGIAKATLEPNPAIPWDDWVGDYSLIRGAIERTWPHVFAGLNERMFEPGGLVRPLGARERRWETSTGRANFLTPSALDVVPGGSGEDVLTLTTVRSNDQFNTTIYGYRDRFRGIDGTRMVVFMNRADIERLGLAPDGYAELRSAIEDGEDRHVTGLRIVPYDIPEGCCAAYYPEANPLIPLSQHDPQAKTPAYKGVPVRVARASAPASDLA
ncbi:MAG: FdhF/YdeP family oxidoreductase [Paracoccaceae bacterium]